MFGALNSESISQIHKTVVDGRGSFGEVYKVRHVKTNEIFAAKKQLTMLGEKSNQDSEREIRILRTVAHVSIVPRIC